jgi:hypothetical protein
VDLIDFRLDGLASLADGAVATAKRFLRKALTNHPGQRIITLDAYAASHRAITQLKVRGNDGASRSHPIQQVLE